MSQSLIRAALETALNGMTPALATAFENNAFTPPASTTPYQMAFMLFAAPENPDMGRGITRERGIFQVTLCYPLQAGDGAARARADLLRATFYRSATFTIGAVKVIMERTPDVGAGSVSGDRWVVPVRCRFFADI